MEGACDELALDAGLDASAFGSGFDGVCAWGTDGWSKKPLLPDSFQSLASDAFGKSVLVCGADEPAKKPEEDPDSFHCDGSLALPKDVLAAGAEELAKKPWEPDAGFEGLIC